MSRSNLVPTYDIVVLARSGTTLNADSPPARIGAAPKAVIPEYFLHGLLQLRP